MAATVETCSSERSKGWYAEDYTEINEPFRHLLETYSKVPSDEVVRHVNKIREQAFATNPYPCIGLYRFLNLTLLTHPSYPSILERFQSPDATYLDLACCFGQDLRQLVKDGVPSHQLIGLDIEKPLMEHGYDLFRDRATIESRFVVADVFKGAAEGTVWAELQQQGFDVIHCSAFFHLFPLKGQISAATNIARLVKKGGIIVGRQMGSLKPGNGPAIAEGGSSFRHDVQTFQEMWDQVGQATDTRWRAEGTLDMVGVDLNSPVETVDSRRLLFTITRLE